jgi:hypothetical protein
LQLHIRTFYIVLQVLQVGCIPAKQTASKLAIIFEAFVLFGYICTAADCSIALSPEREESPVSAEHHTS